MSDISPYPQPAPVQYPKPADFAPVNEFPEGHKHRGHQRCTAWSHRNGRQCLQFAINGTTKCRLHGGVTTRGIANGNYKHGKYSKYIPQRLVPQYKASLRNPDLIAMREEIALMDVRIGELLTKIGSGESADIWKALVEKRIKLIAANQRGNTKEGAVLINELLSLIEQGAAEYTLWLELRESFETRRKLVETETRRLVQAQQMMTFEEAVVLIDQVASILKENVNDSGTLITVTNELTRLLGTTTGRPFDAAVYSNHDAD